MSIKWMVKFLTKKWKNENTTGQVTCQNRGQYRISLDICVSEC